MMVKVLGSNIRNLEKITYYIPTRFLFVSVNIMLSLYKYYISDKTANCVVFYVISAIKKIIIISNIYLYYMYKCYVTVDKKEVISPTAKFVFVYFQNMTSGFSRWRHRFLTT